MKKIISYLLIVTMIVTLAIPTFADGNVDVAVSTQTLKRDGLIVTCEKYLINDNNYFKLRDLAMLLNGTDAEFSVDYDAAINTVYVKTGEKYQPVGGEMNVDTSKSVVAHKSEWKLFVNGSEASCSIYIINGNNYFMLRDIGKALDFNVYYDEAASIANIESSESYTGEAPAGGIEYELLASVNNYETFLSPDDTRGEWPLTYGVNFTSPEFSSFFRNGDGETGLAEIIRSGNVFVNGHQIPYITEDGSYSTTEFSPAGYPGIWQIDSEKDLWGWQLHMMYGYNSDVMANLSGIEDYEKGEAVSFEEAVTYYVKYLATMRGDPVKLYSKKGTDYVSRIESFLFNTAIVAQITDNGDGTTTLFGTDGSEIMTSATTNVDPSIAIGDGILYYEDEDGYVAKRAYEMQGVLIETDDYHHPLIEVDGAKLSTSDTLSDKNLAEAYRHTQFIRGYRRTRQFDNETPVSMWCTTEEGCAFGFTYPASSARDALEYAVKYTSDYAATLKISVDGTDVSTDEYWVKQEDMDVYQTALTDARTLLADSEGKTDAATIFAYNEMILTLADAFGGTEGNNGPGANNSLGIVGSAQPGTRAN